MCVHAKSCDLTAVLPLARPPEHDEDAGTEPLDAIGTLPITADDGAPAVPATAIAAMAGAAPVGGLAADFALEDAAPLEAASTTPAPLPVAPEDTAAWTLQLPKWVV